MSYGTNLRIFDRCIGGNTLRRKHKGKSKKNRRLLRADWADGWSRKKSNSLRPQHNTSKSVLREELKHENWLCLQNN